MRKLHDLLHLLLVLLLASFVAWFSLRHVARSDISHAQRGSLSAASISALDALNGPLEVISYASEGGQLRQTLATFVQRYQEHKNDLSFRFENPDADPEAMRALGISVEGELRLRFGEAEERLVQLSEEEFTRALIKLARSGERIVAVVSGHGERKADGVANHDMNRFFDSLSTQGIRTIALSLDKATVAANVDLLVVASPQVAYAQTEVDALLAYIESGGNLLWLSEPAHEDNLAALEKTIGVQRLPGTVVDGAGQESGVEDPRFVLLSKYPEHPALQKFELVSLLPQSLAWAVASDAPFAAKPLLRSGDKSWNEVDPLSEKIQWDQSRGEVAGPLDLALALTRLSPTPARSEQRVVVIGDGDFLSNSYLGNGGNRDLGQRIVNWLLGDEVLLNMPVHTTPDRELDLSEQQRGYIGLIFLVLLPCSLLLIAATIRWRRKRR